MVGLQGEDWGWRREHSLKGLAHYSWLGGSPGKSLQLPKRQETFSCLFVSWCARRGDSEHRLNELQRRVRATAISANPTATGVQRKKRRDSRTEARHRAALNSPRGLSAHPPGWAGLGAEARASLGSKGEDWGWLHEHSLKGLAHHSWLAGSPGKSLQLPKRQETFSCLFVLRRARRGDSERHLNELQRQARAAAISAGPRDRQEMLLPPPKSLCVSTGHSPHRPSRELVQPATARVP